MRQRIEQLLAYFAAKGPMPKAAIIGPLVFVALLAAVLVSK